LSINQHNRVDLDLDGVVVRRVDHTSFNTSHTPGEMFSILNIGNNVVPGNMGFGTLAANSRIWYWRYFLRFKSLIIVEPRSWVGRKPLSLEEEQASISCRKICA
jgi:hypothetical protein